MRQRLEAKGWDTQVVSKGEHGSPDDMLWAAVVKMVDFSYKLPSSIPEDAV